MSVIHDLRCTSCGALAFDQATNPPDFGECDCGAPFTWIPARLNTDIWGGPRRIASLDREFASRSDLKKELKRCNFEEAGDKVGGARNEDRYRGNHFSFPKQARRGSPRAPRNF